MGQTDGRQNDVPPISLFKDLVGTLQHRLRHREAKRLGSFEVDHQLELGRLLDRRIGRFLALENPPGVNTGLAPDSGVADAIAHQAAGLRGEAPRIDRRNTMA
jgi:hypothetical protein